MRGRSRTVAVLVAALALGTVGGCVMADPRDPGTTAGGGRAGDFGPATPAPVAVTPVPVVTPLPAVDPGPAVTPEVPAAPELPAADPWTPPPPSEPTPRIELPDFVGEDLDDVQDALEALGADDLKQVDATGQGRMQVIDSHWKVCAQDPKKGRTVDVDDRITLAVVKQSERCP